MKINEAGLAIIREFEGLRLTAYRCPAGVATIGYGHTGHDVRMTMTITPDRAEEMLENDLRRFEVGMTAMLGSVPTTSNEFSALVCLAFNIGLGKIATSTVLRRHKAGNRTGAANAFGMWNRAGGRILPGLVRRREAEAALYLGEA